MVFTSLYKEEQKFSTYKSTVSIRIARLRHESDFRFSRFGTKRFAGCRTFTFRQTFSADTTCTLPAKDKQMFLDFFSKHKFPTNWDCGLENLAKGEFDRAEKATKNFPLSDVAAQYYTLTSKGKDLKSALEKIPPLFLEDGEYLNRTAKLGCNRERREELILACVIQPLYETDVDY
ncbi:hypothetical protein DICVIV_00027 [Dictyocaulus viviparus]|uniref:Uncharacterized protein n=1 Tax=Dictyocaulus viviparus TaxID=29172 RepID=A0A0D8YC16_DICVI|nr:hypothetical protein DICVIV_00027 [Dictyocaulus viviparus]